MKTLSIILFVWMMPLTHSMAYQNGEAKNAQMLVEAVNARDEGEMLSQTISIVMTDKRNKTQTRELNFYRKDIEDQRKSVIFYQSPANVKGTAFLTYDYHSPDQNDNQWLYLPALRKTRRISASNRGDYFLGTDLTYEDVKLGTKIGAGDYQFTTVGEDIFDGKEVMIVEGIPNSKKTAKELGYSKVRYTIDRSLMMSLKIEYWDIAGNELKQLLFKDIIQVQGIWTVQTIEAINYKTKHSTILRMGGHDYTSQLPDDLFTEKSLIRGN